VLLGKKNSIVYSESLKDVNIIRKKIFLQTHDPKSHNKKEYIPLLLCASTDESGFKSDISREYGFGFIHKFSSNKKITSLNGDTKYNNTRIHKIMPKHHQFKLNLILTIALDFHKPIQYFEIHDESSTGKVYLEYIENRELLDKIKFDIIDRHTIHRADKSNIKLGLIPVHDVYEIKSLQEDFTPAGEPQFNPVESAFNYIKSEIKKQSINYDLTKGWKKDEFVKIITTAVNSITFKLVQSFYRRTYKILYPGRKPPIYLDPNIDETKFDNECERILRNYEINTTIKTKTSQEG